MKTKSFDCVEMKHHAQEKIYKETKNMTTKQKIAYYNRIGQAARQRQAKLRAKLGLAA